MTIVYLFFFSNSPQEMKERREIWRVVVFFGSWPEQTGGLVGRKDCRDRQRLAVGGASGAGFKLQEHRGCYRCLSCAPVSLSISEQIKKKNERQREGRKVRDERVEVERGVPVVVREWEKGAEKKKSHREREREREWTRWSAHWKCRLRD